MKKLSIMLVLIIGIAFTSTSWALTITREYDPADVLLKAYEKPNSIAWWFDLAPQYNPSTMYVDSAYIKLYLRGDSDDYSETATFQVSTSGLQTWTLTNPNIDVKLEITTGLSSLQDGTGYFLLTATEGDFYFEKAWLSADVKSGTAPVPEPTSLLLLGLGLLGIAGWRRK